MKSSLINEWFKKNQDSCVPYEEGFDLITSGGDLLQFKRNLSLSDRHLQKL